MAQTARHRHHPRRSSRSRSGICRMARWMIHTSYAELGSSSSSGALIALLSTILVFVVCVTALLALCAAHSSSSRDVLNARRETSSEPEELAIAPPEEFKKAQQQDLSSGLSFRLSGGSGGGAGAGAVSNHFKLSSSINKLSSSFRISSFRESTFAAFPGRATSSFRISSFRIDSCKQAEGVVESLQKVRRLDEEPAVWQRAILRGERCAPLSFSGLILYDENGNQLPSSSFTKDSEPEPESPPVLQQQHHLHQQPTTVMETPAFGSRNGNIETGI